MNPASQGSSEVSGERNDFFVRSLLIRGKKADILKYI